MGGQPADDDWAEYLYGTGSPIISPQRAFIFYFNNGNENENTNTNTNTNMNLGVGPTRKVGIL
jgi:hypothetical protein